MKTNYLLYIMMIFWLISIKAYSNDPKTVTKENVETYYYDAIIVPGVPYNDPNMSKILMARIYWSKYLYSKGIAKNIIFSGSAVYTPYVESVIMSLYAQKLGVPAKNILTEQKAEHSVENIYYSYQIAKNKGFKRIALATDPLQSRMLQRFSKKQNLQIDFIPFSFDYLDSLNIHEIEIADDKAFIENFISLEKREGFFKRFRGTIGKNIKYEE